jgi:hypothetical protein
VTPGDVVDYASLPSVQQLVHAQLNAACARGRVRTRRPAPDGARFAYHLTPEGYPPVGWPVPR